ncbi:MAG: electron transfer flavoprotein subunit beta/FixA family protein [Candidatus Wallbacteria bacterium]|nr:electron transfer flavoprotein subunit beta/FixA family protein [Candidatus Wallbacteria bacterium]
MNIIVCVKQVPGTSEVKVDEKTGVLKRDGVCAKINPYDLYALETAMRIKAATGAIVRVLSMGPPQAADVIRESFMMGADEGFLMSDRRFAGADVLATSYTLSQGIRKIGVPDLIICGKMTTDGDTAQVGPEMAEFLGIPHVANVRRITSITQSCLTVEMDMPSCVEIADITCPCLITVEKGINQPRLPSFRLKLATSGWKITILTMEDLPDRDALHYGLNGSPTQVLKVFPPDAATLQEFWRGTGPELADRIFDRLKELKFTMEK